MKRNFHAPFWSSGRRSDPPTDCNGTRPGIVMAKDGEIASWLQPFAVSSHSLSEAVIETK